MKRRVKARKPKRRKSRRSRARAVKSSARSRKPDETERELRRLRSARAKLERRLTAAVQEIGTLRQWEVRATMLEGQLQKSQARIRELESRLGGDMAASPPG